MSNNDTENNFINIHFMIILWTVDLVNVTIKSHESHFNGKYFIICSLLSLYQWDSLYSMSNSQVKVKLLTYICY